MKDSFEKWLDLITQPFEFNQENTFDSEEENLEIEVESHTETTEKQAENIVVDDGVPGLILID